MRHLLVVGIGAGHPDQITIEAIEALKGVDVVFLPDKGSEKSELRETREAILDRHLAGARLRRVVYAMPQRDQQTPDYSERVADWHDAISMIIEQSVLAELDDGLTGAFLVWGDPSLYDSLLRILDHIGARETFAFDLRVIAGVTSVQALTAAFAMPLNRVGAPVTLTPARRLGADPQTDMVVMLDGQLAFSGLDGEAFDIFWGAYLGTEHQVLVSGKLAAVAETIRAVRAEARARHGWIMDTYLLRRRDSGPASD